MPAFVLSEVEIVNEDAAVQYRQLAAASIDAYGGRYLARGAEAHVVEGQATSRRLVLCEFPSLERIREWYASPEYAEALKFREAALIRRLVFFEGVPPPATDWPKQQLTNLSATREAQGRIERAAVRVVLVDSSGAVLLLSTRDASNPDFGVSWELPGGGIASQESVAEAAVREVRETGFHIRLSDVSEPLWHRDVFYTYRGERRLQHESVCVAQIVGTAPAIDTTGRDTIEMEDHLLHRWWRIAELLASQDRFYPRSLPRHIEALLAGRGVDDPLESWDETH